MSAPELVQSQDISLEFACRSLVLLGGVKLCTADVLTAVHITVLNNDITQHLLCVTHSPRRSQGLTEVLQPVAEFCPRGSLYQVLHAPNVHLTWRQIYAMCLGVAKGMAHLHQQNIIHRDLKSGARLCHVLRPAEHLSQIAYMHAAVPVPFRC